jgi:hypothetical protein
MTVTVKQAKFGMQHGRNPEPVARPHGKAPSIFNLLTLRGFLNGSGGN